MNYLSEPDPHAKYLIVDEAAPVFRDERGDLNTSGHFGVLDAENVYLRVYAKYEGHSRLPHLELFQRARARFTLSGEKGTYDIVRVE